ncbi:LysR substrate-binding domain-containing protein [Rhodobacteraceae bacterium DSL-40]|uniref:LysR family transcriptional regulator n=1 Tax=Amaricoccus sp. B4 TaxID=3368557 RepID=UPI000DAE3F4B
MDTNWLEDFLKLAQEGNFSRAAEMRNSSQPAFSRRIRGLEDWIGAELIDRDTHRITLTEAGQAFRSVAEEVVRRLNYGRDQAREIGAAGAGTLRFVATHALSMTFFPDWLRDFSDDQDLATVSLVVDNMVACEQVMLAGTADLLLCHDHPAAHHLLDPGAFRSIQIGEDRLVPVCVPTEEGRPRFQLPGPAEDPLPFLAYDERSGMGRILAAAKVISERRAALRPVFRSHLASALLRMARDGKGLTWAPLSLCKDDLGNGRLVQAASVEWDVPMEIRLFRPRTRRSKIVEAFWLRASKGLGSQLEK